MTINIVEDGKHGGFFEIIEERDILSYMISKNQWNRGSKNIILSNFHLENCFIAGLFVTILIN